MTQTDAAGMITEWYSRHFARWKHQGIDSAMRLPDDPGVNKAAATMETPTHVASITVWGNGMLEFVVLDVARQRDVVMWDREYTDAAHLQSLLEECSESFANLTANG